MSTTVFDLLARVSADVSPFNSAMDNSSESVDSSLASMYQSASRWLGAGGVAGVFYKATAAANEFSQVIADISAITDLQIKGVEQSILRLDNVFGKPVHTASTFYETISSGIRGSTEDISKYVEAVGKAATTIRADIENTGNVMTTLTNAYDLAATDTQQLLDFLYLTVREGKAHGDELARTLGLVINNAAESKVSLEELGAAIAVLSRTQSASQSMIGLNQMLNAFIKPTLQAQAEARKWNIELGASALQAKGLTASLEELHNKVGGNVEALEKMFGNIRAGRAVLALTGNQFDNFIEVLDAFKQGAGSGEEAFSKQIDTAYKDLTRLRAQMDKTLIQIGKDIEPVTRSIYGLSEAVLKGFSDASPLSRYASYIYIVVAAVRALKKELFELKSSLATIAGKQPTAISGAAASAPKDPSSVIKANAMRQAALDREELALATRIKREGKTSTRAFRDTLKYGTRAENASIALAEAQRELKLAQESNASIREQNRLRRIENTWSRRFAKEQSNLEAATKTLTESRKRMAVLEQQRAVLESGNLQEYSRQYGKKFPSGSVSFGQKLREAGTSTMSSILGDGGPLSRLYNGAFAAVSAWSVADIGYNIGKAIADRYNFTDSRFIKALADAINALGGGGLQNTSSLQQELDKYNVDTSRRNANATVERLLSAGQITAYQAEKSKAAIANASTQMELDNINRDLRTTYGAGIEHKTTRQVSLRNARENERRARERVASLERGSGLQIVGERSTALYAGLQKAEDSLAKVLHKVNDAGGDPTGLAPIMSDNVFYKALPEEMRPLFGRNANEALSPILQFTGSGGINDALSNIRKMMSESVKSGDYSAVNQLLNAQSTEELKSTDIGKGLNDIQLKVLHYVLQSINKKMNESGTGSNGWAVNATRLNDANRALRQAVSDRIGTEYNFYVDDLIKKTKVEQKVSGAERARQLLDTSTGAPTDIARTNLQYSMASMEAGYERLSKMMSAFDRVNKYLEPGRVASINEDLTTEGGRLDTLRRQVEQNTMAYVNAVAEEATQAAAKIMENSRLDSGVETAASLDIKVRMQKTILSYFDKEISSVTKELMSPDSSSIRKSSLRTQLSELKKRRDTANADLSAAIREREDYQIQYMGRLSEAGMVSSAEYENTVRGIHGSRLTRAKNNFDQLRARAMYSYVPTEQLQQAQEALKIATLEAAEATKGFGRAQREVQNAMMTQLTDFASQKGSRGRMTQNSLYHSLNLMAKLAGSRAAFTLARNPSYDVMSTPSYKNAQNAQNAIARSLDSYMMSQKYAQASVGSTVTDIYNYIRQNNIITVKG